ncbi:flavin-containing monooxygenase [Pseudonocardia sp. GCM10023141]|uniref:flavin-containing monooxygenase n=1 Tax=Pseudonocardia sp. GCM10023141 TaxID=3252653 RepID=UPI00360AF419
MTEHNELDVLIVGAGFAGLYQLDRLRERGHGVHVLESAPGLGGVWYWNCYPGARVDTWASMYQFSDEDLWKDWDYSVLYPDWSEVREYFRYIDEKKNYSRDISFNTPVDSALFDEATRRWNVTATDRATGTTREFQARHLVLCTGFGSKPFVPDLPGLQDYTGEIHHTARWPQGGLSLDGKRVAVIGTGASGVQVAQEAAPVASQLTVFQRTPNLALPMRQRAFSAEDKIADKETCRERMALRNGTFAGFDYDFLGNATTDVSAEERAAAYEKLWEIGGFVPWLGNFNDFFFNEESNTHFYNFWRDKTRARIDDKDLWESLAPTSPPHPFGVKRPSLEQRYYEIFNQNNVALVDLQRNGISQITSNGIRTADGVVNEFDVIVLATGFDAVTGGITAIDIRNAKGESFAESWKDGAHTALGSATAGFPNLLFVYGPQSPSAFCNGPSCAEAQGEWVADYVDHLLTSGVTRSEATPAAEARWQEGIDAIVAQALFTKAKSWYMGANVPGKKVQMLMYPGGLPGFLDEVNTSKANGYPDFVHSS